MFRNSFNLREKPTSTKNRPDPFGRLGEDDDQIDVEIADIKNPTQLKSPVGDMGQNNRRDVAKAEQLLGNAGTLDLKKTDGPTGYWGARTSGATKTFQKQNNLKVDGQINPDGETIHALSKLGGQAIGTVTQRHVTHQTPRHPGQAARDPGPGVMQHLEGHHSYPRGNKGVDEITEDVVSENARAAHYLASQKGIGDFSKFVADGIELDGDKAIAEASDLYHQTSEMNQEQADALIKKIMPSLSPENAKRLRSATMPKEHDNEQIGDEFGDSSTDDETKSDDNLKWSVDTHDMALQHLIESGLDPELAKGFLDRLPKHSSSLNSNSTLINAMTWLSSKINSAETTQKVPLPFVGGRRK